MLYKHALIGSTATNSEPCTWSRLSTTYMFSKSLQVWITVTTPWKSPCGSSWVFAMFVFSECFTNILLLDLQLSYPSCEHVLGFLVHTFVLKSLLGLNNKYNTLKKPLLIELGVCSVCILRIPHKHALIGSSAIKIDLYTISRLINTLICSNLS